MVRLSSIAKVIDRAIQNERAEILTIIEESLSGILGATEIQKLKEKIQCRIRS